MHAAQTGFDQPLCSAPQSTLHLKDDSLIPCTRFIRITIAQQLQTIACGASCYDAAAKTQLSLLYVSCAGQHSWCLVMTPAAASQVTADHLT